MFKEVIVELSHNCNLNCIMCGFGKGVNHFNKDKYLSFDSYKSILQQIGGKTEAIRLNGRGESTIHPEFVKMLKYTKFQFPQIGINLFSNFSFNSSAIINALISNEVQLFISLDSPIEEELAEIRRGVKFSYVNKNIRMLKELPNRPFIVFTTQELNIHRISDIAGYAHANDCHIIFNTVRRDSGIETFVNAVRKNRDSIIEQFNSVNALYHNSQLKCLCPNQLAGIELAVAGLTVTHGMMTKCSALEDELCILVDGTVTPCNMFNPYEYGNIHTQSLDEIWHGRKRSEFLISHKNHYYCKNCANMGV
ncbi:MAG: SPASM domain-containing protein [Chitinispirillia bacterium]|nr:SPASM domain-containing protein [Chitinispirillia bacterium]